MVRLGVIVTPTKTKCFTALKMAPKIGSCPCKALRLVTVGTSLDHLHYIQYLKSKAIPLLSLRSCRLVHGLSGLFRPPYSLPGHPRVHPMARPSPRRQDMCICSDDFCFQDFRLRCCLTPLETGEVSPPLPPSSDLPRLGRRCPVNQANKILSLQYVVGGHHPSNSRVSELSVGTTGDWRSDTSVVISEAS